MAAETATQVAPIQELPVSAHAEPVIVVTTPPMPEYTSPAHIERTTPMPVERAAPAPVEREPAAVVVSEAPSFEADVEQPRRETPRQQPPAAQAPAPRVDPQAMLGSSGLVMIETDPSKARTVAPALEQPMPLGRPRRERPPEQAAEPLVQIETHNK